MRRIIITGAALAALAGATAAWAADANTYGGSLSFSPKKVGTAKKPVPVGWTQTITATSNQSGFNAAPLTHIKTWIYGIKVDKKILPTCSPAKIIAAKNDNVCPKGAMVASGSVESQLGSQTRQGPTVPCNPLLHAWNGAGATVVYFFVITATHQCAGLQTGAANPYTGKFSRSGKNMVLDVPLPPDVSTMAGGEPLYGSLVSEQLSWKKISKKVKGKKVGYFSTFACKAKKRPYKTTYTDTTGSSTVAATDAC